MRILVTGSTGFIGKALALELIKSGHELIYFVRNKTSAQEKLSGFPGEWVESFEELETLNPIQAVVHLAGENIASGRWTDEVKQKVLDSRVQTTEALFAGLARLKTSPEVIISTSAIGIYGDRQGEELDEKSQLPDLNSGGGDFLSKVCQAWEGAATNGLKRFHNQKRPRLVLLRVGVVLERSGGALEKMLPLFQMGLGGRLGSGQQFMSVIHRKDLIRLIQFLLKQESIEGPVNAVCPEPVTNQYFTNALAHMLKRPAFAPAPAAALKLVMGEMSTMVLGSQRVLPNVALAAGFIFKYPTLNTILKDITDNISDYLYENIQWIPAKRSDVFAFFSQATNLEKMTPGFLNFKILKQSTPQIEQGTLIEYQIKLHGVPVKWKTLIETWQPQDRFVDTQLRGPFAKWHHTHEFYDIKQHGQTLMIDRVFYRLPLSVLGKVFGSYLVKRDVESIFNFRVKVIQDLFHK